MSSLQTLLVAFAVYAVLVIVLGIVATRRAGNSPEEYFLAGRRLGTLVLFMALFGTNTTSFVLVGVPGLAYERGIGVFGLNAPIVALGVPLTFWAIGSPARAMAARLGALTPAELYARRFESYAVGAVLFGAFALYTLPYMVQGVKGAAVTLEHSSDGAVPAWLGAASVVLLAVIYTSLGGMRATAWTNVFQGFLFLVFLVAAFVWIGRSLGGPAAATRAVLEHDPELLRVPRTGLFAPGAWTSWGLVIALTVIGFPHMFARLLAAESDAALRTVTRLYPLALALLWVPAVMIGVWGAAAFPGLENPDEIFSRMTREHLPEAFSVLAFLAVLAAVMSTLDAQILTLSSMLVRDVLDPLRGSSAAPGEPAGRREVVVGRVFGVAVAAIVYVLALVWNDSVFTISRRAFEGYVTIVPTLLLGVRWRRFTARAAVASIVVGNAVLVAGWTEVLPTGPFLPAFWGFFAALATAGVVSLLDAPPSAASTERAFGPRRGVRTRRELP